MKAWLAILALFGLIPVEAHEYHAGLVTLRVVEQTQLQISLRLFANDLERALNAQEPLTQPLADTPQHAALIKAYLDKRLPLLVGDHQLDVQWVGLEQEVDLVYLYLEATLPAQVSSLSITAKFFLELFTDQVNTVNIYSQNGLQTLHFSHGQDSQQNVFL